MNTKTRQPLRFCKASAARGSDGRDRGLQEAFLKKCGPDWKPLAIACGKCIHCRLQNSKEKAIRAIHQAKSSPTEQNCFLTLTYDDDHVPKDSYGNLVYDMKHIKGFMDDLRDWLRYENQKKTGEKKIPPHLRIKSFGCAEYGDQLGRPHFHLILFNFDFPDKKFHRYSENDWSDEKHPTYTSELLTRLWPYGISEIGSVTENSAAYVARYVTKKISGEKALSHYEGRPPERIVCNSQGIGLEWLKRNQNDVFNSDSVIYKWKEMKIPRYYEKKLEQMDPVRYQLLKDKRLEKIREIDLDSTRERLAVRKKVHEYKAKQLIRKLK